MATKRRSQPSKGDPPIEQLETVKVVTWEEPKEPQAITVQYTEETPKTQTVPVQIRDISTGETRMEMTIRTTRIVSSMTDNPRSEPERTA